MTPTWPAGTIAHLDGDASPQFGGDRQMRVRIIAIDPRPTYYGWAWITAYVLASTGVAVAKRELYVRVDGVRVLSTPTAPTPAASRGSTGTAGARRRPAPAGVTNERSGLRPGRTVPA